jgi:hypothetical protein
MTRLSTTIAAQSIVAAAIIAIAPLASAAPSYAHETGFESHAAKASQVSREDVRHGAVAAARQVFNSETGTHGTTSEPVASTLSRAEVRAQAIEAQRMARFGGYATL